MRAYAATTGVAAALVLLVAATLAAARSGAPLEHVGPIELAPPLDTRTLAPVLAASAAPLLLVGGSARWTPPWSPRTRTLRATLAGAGPVLAWLAVGITAKPHTVLAGLAVTAGVLAAIANALALATGSLLATLVPTCLAAISFFWRASARTSHGPLGVFFGEEWSALWVGLAVACTASAVAIASLRRPADSAARLPGTRG